MNHEADRDIAAGRVKKFDSVEDMLNELNEWKEAAKDWSRLDDIHRAALAVSEEKRKKLRRQLDDVLFIIGKVHGPQPNELRQLSADIAATLSSDVKE